MGDMFDMFSFLFYVDCKIKLLVTFFLMCMHGENQRSVELNPMQKDLVLKIAELLCSNDIADGRAEYWVEKAARLFPGNPAAYRLKVNSSF